MTTIYSDEEWPFSGEDKAATEERVGQWMRHGLRDGVIPKNLFPELALNELEVTADGVSMAVKVASGFGAARNAIGRWNGESVLAIDAADGVNDRIDLVLQRADFDDAGRMMLTTITGTPAASPVAPEAPKTAAVWGYPLAEVLVEVGDVVVNPANVTKREVWAVERFELPFVLGSGTSEISTGLGGHVYLPENETIRIMGWKISEIDTTRAGNIVVDLWHDVDRASVTDADSITGGNEPDLTAEAENSGDVSGWSTTELRGGCLVVNVDSVTTVQQVTLSLAVIKIPYSAK